VARICNAATPDDYDDREPFFAAACEAASTFSGGAY
jgi:hypothetical protein